MTEQEQYQQVKSELEQVEEHLRTWQFKRDELQDKLFNLSGHIVKERGLLSKAKWRLQEWASNYSLCAVEGEKDLDDLLKFFKVSGYHDQFQLAGGRVVFDDGRVTIYVDHGRLDDVLNFIKEYGLSIDLTNLEKASENLQRQIEANLKVVEKVRALQ